MKESDIIINSLNKHMAYMGDWIILHKFASNPTIKLKVEIGTGLGLGSIILSAGGGAVYTIDNYTAKGMGCKDLDKSIYYERIKNYLDLYSNGNIRSILKDSEDAFSNFDDNSIDLILIDGNHSFPQVEKDYKLWFPKIKKDGVILFHDVDKDHPGVLLVYEIILKLDIEKGIIKELAQKIEYQTSMKVFVKL
ncbi:MAG: class I SAM-dependent methyltransferase [Candidatus Hodarchaeota archaeon]